MKILVQHELHGKCYACIELKENKCTGSYHTASVFNVMFTLKKTTDVLLAGTDNVLLEKRLGKIFTGLEYESRGKRAVTVCNFITESRHCDNAGNWQEVALTISPFSTAESMEQQHLMNLCDLQGKIVQYCLRQRIYTSSDMMALKELED